MKRQDWVTKQMLAYGYRAEKSAFGGYHVECDWDYAGESKWLYFSSYDSIMDYFKRNGLV